ELVDVNIQEFYGPNNQNFKALKSHFPKLKIVGRGRNISAVGNEELLQELNSKIAQILSHIQHYNQLKEKDIEEILASKNSDNQNLLTSNEVIVHGVSGKLIKAQTPGQKELVKKVIQNDMV